MEMDQLNVRKFQFGRIAKKKQSVDDILGPISVSFTIKLRGVPFEAREKEIYDVR